MVKKKERKFTVSIVEEESDENLPIYFIDFIREVIRVNQSKDEKEQYIKNNKKEIDKSETAINETREILYTVKEVAALLKCNENAVNGLINSGKLKCLILGRRKIPRKELLRFLDENLGQDVTDPFNVKPMEFDITTKY